MKKLESNLRNMVLVLMGVTVVAVTLLAGVNQLTKEPIQDAKHKKLIAAISQVIGDYDNDPTVHPDTLELDGIKYVIYEATKRGKPVGIAVETSDPKGFGGTIKLLVGFDEKGNILDYSLLSMQETPGLGSKVINWFKKGKKGDIIGKNPGKKPLMVRKDGGDVDAITASTITSRAFLRAVNRAYEAYEKKVTGVDGTSGASVPY